MCTAHSDPSSVRHGPGPCIPPRCPTAGTSVVPMVPLVRCLRAGSCPDVSLAPKDHLTRLCNSVRPASSQVQGHPPHSSEGSRCPWLVRGISVLLAKDVMVPVPPADMKARVFSPYFIVPKKSGGLRPILGLRILNWAFHKPPFKMLMQNRVFGCIRPQVRSAALTWRPVLPCVDPSVPQAIPAVCVRRTSISVQVLPFGLSLSPRVFTKVAEAALVPLREQGVRILNYLDDWLILAQSQDQLCEHRDWCSRTSASWAFGSTGKRANSCQCRGSLFSVWKLDLVNQTARLTQERAQSELNCLNTFKNRMATPLKQVSEAPGAYGGCSGGHTAGAAPYETASTLALWPSPEVGVAEQHAAGPSHSSLPPNFHPLVRPFISSGRSAPGTGLQARCGLHGCLRQGLGGHIQRACSVGGLDGSPTALVYQLPRVAGSTPGLEPSQETLTRRARTGPYGQHCDRCVHQPTRWSTLPSHVATRPPPPPLESEASEVASCHSYSGLAQPDSRQAVMSCAPRKMETPSPDGPADLRRFGLAQVDLFASLETSHCQLFYSLNEGTLGWDALAHSWPRGLRKYAFPPVSLLAQTLCKVREEEEQILLVAPYWPTRTWFPELMFLVTAPPWQIPLRKDLLTQRRGTLWHLRPDLWKLHVWSLDGTRRF